MEALTYDRAIAFKDELPPEDLVKWQPRKLMAALVEFDPWIRSATTLAVGIEKESGKPAPPEEMKVLGTDFVFTLSDLKSNYDAMGSYLHMPTLAQVQSGKTPDLTKLRERCEIISGLIEKVLDSDVWNCAFGITVTLDHCMNKDCGKPLTRRIPPEKDSIDVRCLECEARYIVTAEPDGRFRWSPDAKEVACAAEDCTQKALLWLHLIKPGTIWRCNSCGVRNQLALGVRQVESGGSTSDNP